MYSPINSNSNLFFENVYFYFMSKFYVVICVKRQSYLQVYWNRIIRTVVSLGEMLEYCWYYVLEWYFP
jgi:hypothetical protein